MSVRKNRVLRAKNRSVNYNLEAVILKSEILLPLTLMHGKISLLLYDYQTQLKTPFNRTCSPVLFAEFNISKFCALNNLTLAKAVDDTDRKSRHQTDRSPFILRVQKKTIKQVTNGGKGASKSNRTSVVVFCFV